MACISLPSGASGFPFMLRSKHSLTRLTRWVA